MTHFILRKKVACVNDYTTVQKSEKSRQIICFFALNVAKCAFIFRSFYCTFSCLSARIFYMHDLLSYLYIIASVTVFNLVACTRVTCFSVNNQYSIWRCDDCHVAISTEHNGIQLN